MKISNVKSYLVEDIVKPFTWQVDRPGSGDGRDPRKNFSCIMVLETDEGISGFAKGPKGRIMMDLVERRFSSDFRLPSYSWANWPVLNNEVILLIIWINPSTKRNCITN